MTCRMSKLNVTFQDDIKGNIKEMSKDCVEEMSWNEFPLIKLIVKENIEAFNRIMSHDPLKEQRSRGCGGGP